MRIFVANRNSYSPKSWLKWMQHVNTGTYNTQWLIFDAKKARKSKFCLLNHTFILAEQVPGKIFAKDLSESLSKVVKLLKTYLKIKILSINRRTFGCLLTSLS